MKLNRQIQGMLMHTTRITILMQLIVKLGFA